MLNLASVFDYSAKQNPNKTAVVCGPRSVSFAQLLDAVDRVASGLVTAGVGPGDRVALSCPNLPYFPMVYYGILKAGAVVVPLNLLLKGREIAYHLKDSDAKAYFCFEGTPELPMAAEGHKGFSEAGGCERMWVITADPAAASPIEGVPTLGQLLTASPPGCDMVQTQAGDTAVILYTSGTTGFPKGAELTHANMTMNALMSRQLFSLTPDDVEIVALPLFHSFGQTCLMNAGFSAGNTLVFIPRFAPEAVLGAVQDHGATVFAGVPTMYWALLHYQDKAGAFDFAKIARTLRLGVSGGASLPVEVLRGFEEKYEVPILEGYGLSETSPVATFNHLHRPRKPGSIGTPIWGVEAKVVDAASEEVASGQVGEITIRGHNVMKGYYNKPQETEQAFRGGSWFHTGDLARRDEDGYLFIVDRVKDMIIRGGFNVYPREVEEVLLTHPAVSLAAVVGVPHDRHGEEVKAFLVLKAGQSVPPEEILAWCQENMAAYKYPRLVEIREKLPMTATGKLLKRELQAEAR